MKKTFYTIFILFLNLNTIVFADTGIFGTCLSETDIKQGDKITVDTIPCVINSLINVLMGLAGTISIVFIIIGAYQMLFGSLAKDNAKGKATITFAITGFVLAASSWLIIKFIFNNFGT